MTDYCAFSKDHKCLKWMDYELTRFELEEAEELCHGNWIEIQYLCEYINLLEKTLKEHGIEIPKDSQRE
ncbi:MAG: mobility-associated LCxxNW protein [Lachnospiraceae bacterium]|nr:mobility-associated LCxxNW protein [Lachnospiraceae bacterium]